MVTRTWPVLQSFEKDLTKIVFVINQISGGLTQLSSGVTPAGGRIRLTTPTTFYVAPTPTGSNVTGLGTVGSPWETIQFAFDTICAGYDFGGQGVTIQLADGTYTAGLQVIGTWTGGGFVTINGNAATPSNVVVNPAGATAFRNVTTLPGNLVIQNLKMGSGAGSCIDNSGLGVIGTGVGCIFGAATVGHLVTTGTGAIIFVNQAYTVNGNTTYHWLTNTQSSISTAGFTITISGSPTITYWALAQIGAVISTPNTLVFSGSPAAGCQKYLAQQNAVISSQGTVYPGTVAGVTATGGLYS